MSFQYAQVRRMSVADLDRVLEIAASLLEAPHWTGAAYLAAIDRQNEPRRIALVVEEISEGSDSGRAHEVGTTGAKALASIRRSSARLKSCPDTKHGRDGVSRQPVKSSPDTTPSRIGCERVLGFAVASLLPPESELETIAVDPRFQRRGLGALLLREVAAELRKEHVKEMLLEVRASNRTALGFYGAQGFEECGRRVRYYADPEEDAVLMRWKLA